MERTQIVARYSNGKIIKGHTIDFFPNKDRFHVTLIDKPSDSPIEVMVNRLKACVVRDLKGNPQYVERKSYMEGETPYANGYGTPVRSRLDAVRQQTCQNLSYLHLIYREHS